MAFIWELGGGPLPLMSVPIESPIALISGAVKLAKLAPRILTATGLQPRP